MWEGEELDEVVVGHQDYGALHMKVTTSSSSGLVSSSGLWPGLGRAHSQCSERMPPFTSLSTLPSIHLTSLLRFTTVIQKVLKKLSGIPMILF